MIAAIRRTMDELDFIDVWTPSMTRGTPEGARDFLVPVRLQPGKFFALAQSPQLFKQLCMVGGIDRYYQIATCWRDEDLRADRQFEFRQLDLELAFAEREDVLDVMEAAVVASFEALGREAPARPFPRLAYDDVMLRFGTDKPDLRYGLEIQEATEVTRGSEFGVFAGAPCVRYLVAPQARSRAPSSARLEEVAKEWGAKGLAYIVVDESGEMPLADREVPLRGRAGRVRGRARLDGALRRRRARASSRACSAACACTSAASSASPRPAKDVFHWVLDFPLFERDDAGPLDVPAPSVHRARCPGDEEWDEHDPGRRSRASTTT